MAQPDARRCRSIHKAFALQTHATSHATSKRLRYGKHLLSACPASTIQSLLSGRLAGVTTPLFGIAGGAISTTDKDCETRNTAALTITGLKDEATAREIMCEVR